MSSTIDKPTEIMAYATSGREFEVMRELSYLGVDYWPGRKIEFERRGKSRIAEPFEYAALPNYLRISAPWHLISAVMDIRHLSRTIKFLGAGDLKEWAKFQAESDARYAKAKAIIAEHHRMADANASRQEIINLIAQYKAGDALEISGGAFAGMLASFGRMAVKPGTSHPMVEAKLEIFGRETAVSLDPLDVRKAG